MHYLGGMTAALATLDAKPGDWLCFLPTGPAAANLTLQRAAEGVHASPAGTQQQQQVGARGSQPTSQPTSNVLKLGNHSTECSGCSDLSSKAAKKRSSNRDGPDAQPSLKRSKHPLPAAAATQQQQPAQPTQPTQRQGKSGQYSANWQGLEPFDAGCYSMLVHEASIGPQHRTTIPGKGYLCYVVGTGLAGTDHAA